MTRIVKTFSLPDNSTTQDFDTYVSEWQAIAQPIEDALEIKLMHFDPEFIFSCGNPQRPGIKTIRLDPWFAKILSEHFQKVAA